MFELQPSVATQLHLLGLVAVAVVLGAVIGFDREAAHKPAGLRTHMLVAGAGATVVVVSRVAFASAETGSGDPNRAVQAVIMGIGFLGAGTILHREADQKVEGLTTAASLFLAAAIGVTVGFDLVPLAAGVALLVVFTLAVVGWATDRLEQRHAVVEETPEGPVLHRRPTGGGGPISSPLNGPAGAGQRPPSA